MLGVVPGEENVTEAARVLDRSEAVGKVGAVLHRLELRLGEGIVVRDVGPRVGLGDPEIREQKRHGLRFHRGPAIGMQRELAPQDSLTGAALLDKFLRQQRAFVVGDHPPDDVPAEYVHDHVGVEVRPLRRPERSRDIMPPLAMCLNSLD